jgi:hypothetical protein
MTHDVDALVKRLAGGFKNGPVRIAGLVNDNHDAMLVSSAVRLLIADVACRASEANATALQAEHEARVKVESELVAVSKISLGHFSTTTQRAQDVTRLEAQLASAREALGPFAAISPAIWGYIIGKLASHKLSVLGRVDEREAHAALEAAKAMATAQPRAREALRSLPAPAAELVSHDTSAGETQEGLLIADETQTAARTAVRRVRHIKRGTTYQLLGEAEVQISRGAGSNQRFDWRTLKEGDSLVAYRCEQSGNLWLRFPDEFEDGRFEDLTAQEKADG